MKRLLLIFLLFARPCAYASDPAPQHYSGVVQREEDSKPVPNVPVSANVDPGFSLAFWELRSYAQIAHTRTDAQGRFEFTLVAPRSRLWFMAWGMPKIIPTGPSDSTIELGDRIMRQPDPSKLNIIVVPRTFRPRTESIYHLTTKHPIF